MRMKHNETGRSMVEMLGVLAVVGVLSIGGVAGYRYAVDKMNANEIINELKKRAITASQQRVLGQDINLAEYGVGAKIKGTYTVTPTINYEGNASQFALGVAGVPERVCDMILESDWALPTEKVVANGSCVEGGNTMTFAFNNTLESEDAGNGGNTGTSGRPPVDPNNECAKNDATPLRDQQGNCHSCDEAGVVLVGDSGDCSVCDGTRGAKRYVSIYSISGKACVVANDCATGSEPNDATGRCECPENHLLVWGGECVPCSDLSSNNLGTYDGFTHIVSVIEDTADEGCSACGWVKKSLDWDLTGMAWCAKEEKKEICGKDGCYDCSYNSYAIFGIDDPLECSKCDGSGRKWVPTIAPDDPDYYGPYRCVSCDESGLSDIEDRIENTCRACNRGVDWDAGYWPRENAYMCAPGQDDIGSKPGTVTTATETTTVTVTETVSPEVSGGGQICGTNGNCYNCSDYDAGNYGIEVNNQSDCSVCDETGHQWVAVYFANASGLACRACKDPYFSDIEDHIEESCDKCGFGVDWSVAHGSYDNHLWYSCAPTSEDIGTKPNS